MSLVQYDPWATLTDVRNEIDRLFGRNGTGLWDDGSRVATSEWVPAVDIREDNDKYVIHADLPGVDPNNIDLTLEKGVLSIRGERRFDSEQAHQGYSRVERARGVFHRRFSLPDTADSEKVSARYINGVLEVTIPKQEQVQPKRISVSAK